MGVFDVFISDWIEEFGRENVHVISLEEREKDPVTVVGEIIQLLELGGLFSFIIIHIDAANRPHIHTEIYSDEQGVMLIHANKCRQIYFGNKHSISNHLLLKFQCYNMNPTLHELTVCLPLPCLALQVNTWGKRQALTLLRLSVQLFSSMYVCVQSPCMMIW